MPLLPPHIAPTATVSSQMWMYIHKMCCFPCCHITCHVSVGNGPRTLRCERLPALSGKPPSLDHRVRLNVGWTCSVSILPLFLRFSRVFFDLSRRQGGSPWDRRGIPASSCSFSKATSEMQALRHAAGSKYKPSPAKLGTFAWRSLVGLGVGHRGNSWANGRI